MADNGELSGYKCPNCAAPLVFNGELQKMVCEYCDSQFDMSEFSKDAVHRDENLKWETSTNTSKIEGEGMKEYVCSSCGAGLITGEGTGATECPYCGNPVNIKETFEGMNVPDGLIPFALKKDAAKDALIKFYGDKKLLPDDFKDQNHLDNIMGLYVPFWLFSCTADGAGYFNATKERRIQKPGNDQREIKEFRVMRKGRMDFVNVPADGSKEMDDAYMDSIEPYDYSKITDYNPAYLSGYVANKYDEDQEAVKNRVTERLRTTVANELEKTVTGYDTVSKAGCDVDMLNPVIKNCLMPVWMLSTKYNDQVYSFAMNGQTGKVTGNLPIDPAKKTKEFIIPAIITFVIAVIICLITSAEFMGYVVALIIAAAVGWIKMSSEVSKMSAHKGTQASNYLVKNSFKLESKQDKLVNTRYEEIREN